MFCRSREAEAAGAPRDIRAENCLLATKDLRNAMPQTAEVELLAPPRGAFMWRKALEITFAGSGTKINLITDKDPKQERRKTEPYRGGGEIVVGATGLTYADITRELGQCPRGNAEITAIRRTTTGDIALTVKGPAVDTQTLHEAIATRLPGTRLKTTGRNKVLHIHNLEENCEKADIEEGIRTFLRDPSLPMTVSSVRAAYRGSRNATVILAAEKADALLQKGRVLIGIVSATVKERLPSKQCSKCWLPAHGNSPCTGPDKSKQSTSAKKRAT